MMNMAGLLRSGGGSSFPFSFIRELLRSKDVNGTTAEVEATVSVKK